MPDNNDILGTIMRNEYYMTTAVGAAQANLAVAIDELERRIIKEVSALKVKGTSLVGPKVNLKQAQKIHKDLTKHFLKTYGAEARKTVTGFKKAATYVNSNWAELDPALAFTGMDAEMIRTLGKQYYGEFAKYGTAAQSAISTAMYNSIAGQQPYSELVKSISAALTGKYSKLGAPMSQYADLFVFDGMMNFSQATNLVKAEEGGFDTFLYYGNVMTTTRGFCRDRVGKVFERKEIEGWTFRWKGKSGPAMTHRGGYNCRHHWQPVESDWLDKDDPHFLERRTADATDTYYLTMEELAPYKVKPGSLSGKFVEALIAKPMTNAEIKALPWNLTGNLHNGTFKILKDKGIAGVGPGGKKWIKNPDLQVAEVVDKPSPVIKTGVVPNDLQAKLKTTSGNPSMTFPKQWADDPNLDKIYNHGEYSDVVPSIFPGVSEEHHWNVAKLYAGGDIDDIVVGYTQNNHGWHKHTWGLKGETIVETTASNVNNVAYYGYKLNKTEAKAWVAFTKEHPPGTGFVNTMKGGSIDDIVGVAKKKAEAVVEIIPSAKGVPLTPEDLGWDSKTLKGKFLQALIDKPMTNAEIKALPFNTSHNLHHDVFSKLKAQGYAGTHKGKKWVSLTGEPPESLVKGTLSTVIEEAAPTANKAALAKKADWDIIVDDDGSELWVHKKTGEVVKKEVEELAKVTDHLHSVKSMGYSDADNDYFFTASNAHITEIHDKYSKIDNLTSGRFPLKGLRLNNGTMLPEGKGIIGKYSAKERTIHIAGEMGKEHTLTLGVCNVSKDYYGILRHEYAHHIWDINKADVLVNEFRQLHTQLTKMDKNIFKWSVSRYAHENVADAFAEAFSAYTSPLYERKMLQPQLENFFDHWLDGKAATYNKSWVSEKIMAKADPKRMFTDKAHQKMYEEFEASYTKKFDDLKQRGVKGPTLAKEAKATYKRDIQKTWVGRGADSWQGSTNHQSARLIKFKAEQIENRPIKTRITKMSSKRVSQRWAEAEKLDAAPYIRAKALTKAYHKAIGQKTIKMYRGIGGSHSGTYLHRIKELQRDTPKKDWAKTKVLFKEDSLVGYSGNRGTPSNFAEFAVIRKIDVDDILLSDKVWVKRSHIGEQEYIVIGGNYEVMLDQIIIY